jgi:DNA-directed RNA polymerase specialized sigma24 family protein
MMIEEKTDPVTGERVRFIRDRLGRAHRIASREEVDGCLQRGLEQWRRGEPLRRLIRRMRCGDREAAAALRAMYLPRLQYLAQVILRGADRTHDLAARCFEEVRREREELTPEAGIVHMLVQRARRRALEQITGDRADPAGYPDEHSMVQLQEPWTPDPILFGFEGIPEPSAIERQRVLAARAEQALSALPDALRTLARLRFQAGVRAPQLAWALEIDRESLSRGLEEAAQALTAALEPFEVEPSHLLEDPVREGRLLRAMARIRWVWEREEATPIPAAEPTPEPLPDIVERPSRAIEGRYRPTSERALRGGTPDRVELAPGLFCVDDAAANGDLMLRITAVGDIFTGSRVRVSQNGWEATAPLRPAPRNEWACSIRVPREVRATLGDAPEFAIVLEAPAVESRPGDGTAPSA